MSDAYLLLKWLHIVSSTILFGGGIVIAFFFVLAKRTGDAQVIATVAHSVVLADFLFTATAVVLQPLTGFAMVWLADYPYTQPWLLASILLYLLIGACWLPVVWLQIKMRNLARTAAKDDSNLPRLFHTYYRRWLTLGWPAFVGVLFVFYLMTRKPGLWDW